MMGREKQVDARGCRFARAEGNKGKEGRRE
jgi:hypothetical protein